MDDSEGSFWTQSTYTAWYRNDRKTENEFTSERMKSLTNNVGFRGHERLHIEAESLIPLDHFAD